MSPLFSLPNKCIPFVCTKLYTDYAYREALMPATGANPDKTRSQNINLRVTRSQKALIDRAATALRRSRSDFMLETACREAEAVLLDRRYFSLSAEDFKRFKAVLDRPPKNNPGLRRLLQTKAPWEL